MYSTSDFKRGLKIEMDNTPFIIMEFQHVKPGKGAAFVRTKLRNLLNSRVIDKTFRSGEKVGEADIEERSMQFLYRDGDSFVMMDNDTYEQTFMHANIVGETEKWLLEDTTVSILIYKGEPVSIDVPNSLNLEVIETDPGLKGDTAQGGSKPATLSTGAVINVPLFINEGDILKVDTRTGSYIERINR